MATGLVNLMQCCSYNDLPGATDAELYERAVSPSGYVYFNGGLLLAPDPASPHGSFKLRFNDLAASALDANGRLPVGHIFPNGSMLVKEVYEGGNLVLYAVMRKDPSSPNAGNGWLWAELGPAGEAAFTVKRRGDGCISCHSTSPNRDLTRTFDLH
jgi:hypothetical protein